tara:strand:+ start:432 stop:719 length:288 start_codon:yes stop_codon:yes gene_type:complete
MGKLSKKVGRKKGIKAKKDAEEALTRQVSMFGLRPDNCSICNSDFDKNSKEMAMTWRVVVSEEQKRVTLICPDCQQKVEEGMQKVFGGTDDEAGI